jgi:hypothetical protein
LNIPHFRFGYSATVSALFHPPPLFRWAVNKGLPNGEALIGKATPATNLAIDLPADSAAES